MITFRKSPRKSNLNYEFLSLLVQRLKNYTAFFLQRSTSNTRNFTLERVATLTAREPHTTETLAAWAAADPLVQDNVGADQNDQISDAAVNTQRTVTQEEKKKRPSLAHRRCKKKIGAEEAISRTAKQRTSAVYKDFCWTTDLLGSTHAQDRN
jgi:hypothetical protein